MEIGRTQSSGTPSGGERPVDELGDGGLGEEADRQVGDGDADLCARQLGREAAQRRLDAGGARSPSSTARSTLLRSTVTNANSAATNIPHAATSSNEMASRIVALIVAPMLPAYADRPGGRAPL